MPHSRSSAWLTVAAISLLLGGSAAAQTANDIRKIFGDAPPSAKVQTAYAEWRRRPQSEIDCIDKSLHSQGSGVWRLIQRGVHPSDAGLEKLRATCQNPTKPPVYATATNKASQALASASESAAQKAAPEHPSAEKAAVTGTEAEKIAANKTAADEAAAEKAAADKVTANKIAADKAAADKTAAEKSAAEKTAAEKTAAEKAAAEKVATEKATAEKVAAEKAAEEKATAEKAAAEKAVAGRAKAVADNAAPDRTALDLAKADAERAKAEAAKARADAERARNDAEKAIAKVGLALASAERKIGFIYGLMSGLMAIGLGAGAFLAVRRYRNKAVRLSEAIVLNRDSRESQLEFARMIAAALAEQQRPQPKAPKPNSVAPKQPVEERAPH